ncbi:MAG: pantetheine-phosphate adenylyltransferase [Tannerella sp.]|nr:pantetheine-phosphate adenylyltransferase [Tannerella sp.]
MRRAIFPGTFDPFTVGHRSLVERSLRLVDEVIVSIGVNRSKQGFFPLEKRLEGVERIYEHEPRVRVMAYDSLTVDFARKVNAEFIVRGIRTINDFEYEKNIADVNRKLTGIDTFILFAEPEYTFVSSSIVRELLSYGKDVSAFVPNEFQLYEPHED